LASWVIFPVDLIIKVTIILIKEAKSDWPIYRAKPANVNFAASNPTSS